MEIEKRSKNIFVLGCGRWGSFIGWYLDSIGHKVKLYGRKNSNNMKRFMETRQNDYITLPESIILTTNLEDIKEADYVVVSVSSQSLSEVLSEVKKLDVKEKTFILCMKGIEIETGKRLSEIAEENLDESNKIAVWLGPGHVQEFYRGVPNCMVIDSKDDNVKNEVIENISSNLIRFYYGTDLIGNEIGAAAKNVIGIAAGMLDGFDLSSLKGALMSRGTMEISRLITAMGGKPSTVYGLCHLGDYEATLFSNHSQNLTFGRSVIKKEPYEKLAEGYYTVKALRKLGEKYYVVLPITEAVYRILYENKDPKRELDKLFQRSLKDEFI
ncbi:MAG: NAD(P)H-dependent glycerol-3-phosphate dehydrogenase [Erysipelotrichia bacterium]|nr:NAD(P)H-dependent glycerol-3-phosphate dehydrogenase [Erysipelotrichia bacterium]